MRAHKTKRLVEAGLSTKLISTLSDRQLNEFYKRMVSEVTMVSKDDATTIKQMKDTKKPFEVYEDNKVSKDMKKTNGKSKKDKQNPWAICTSQLGKEFKTKERSEWSPKQMAKYERCVKDVKQSIKEGKNPLVSLYENQILNLIEKHITPMMTKGDLLKHIKEGTVGKKTVKKMDKPKGKFYTSKKDMTEQPSPVKTPTKPKIDPGTKPKRPSPYQPPKELPKEAPKAEDLKQMFMKTLTSMFKK